MSANIQQLQIGLVRLLHERRGLNSEIAVAAIKAKAGDKSAKKALKLMRKDLKSLNRRIGRVEKRITKQQQKGK